MPRFARSLKIACTGSVVIAMWLCIGQPARGGDGGNDLAGLQTYIEDVCSFFAMSSCPQMPTISQAVHHGVDHRSKSS